MTREEYEELQSGEMVEETEEQDAAVEEETEAIEENEESEELEELEDEELDDSEEFEELPEGEKTAFAKRLEREQKKIREQAEKELREEYEQQFSKHKSVIDLLGGDPEQVEQMIRDNQMRAEANRLAEENYWTPEQTQYYIQQQQKDQELADLKVQVQINELKDDPDYAGIGNMKKEIQTLINRSNGSLSVEQAFWALGGKERSEQAKREAEQREIARRSKPKRTVQSDSSTSSISEKSLSAEDERLRQRMGLSVTEAKKLLKDSPSNLEDFRKQKK